MTTRTSLVVAILLMAAALSDFRHIQAAEGEIQKGQRVAVMEQTPLMDEDRTLLTVSAGRILSVRRVRDNWLLVTVADGDKETTGWIDASHVISMKTALARLKENVRYNSQDATVWCDLGLVQAMNGYFGDAFDSYSEAVELNTDSAKAHYGRGYMYWLRGEFVKAAMDFAIARRLEANLPEADRAVSVPEVPIQAGDKITTIYDTQLKDEDRVLLVVPAATEFVASKRNGDWVAVKVKMQGKPVSGWLYAPHVTRVGIGPRIEEEILLSALKRSGRTAEFVQVLLEEHVSGDGVALQVLEYALEDLRVRQRPAALWSCVIRDGDNWRRAKTFLLNSAPNLMQGGETTAQTSTGGRKTVSLLFRIPPHRTFSAAPNAPVVLSTKVQQYLDLLQMSDYPTEKNVLIIAEPHFDLQQQIALLKGLEILLAENPAMVEKGKTVFLAEGYPAGKPLSVASLIAAEPRPNNALLKKVLGTYLIPAYMACEWKHQYGISILGSEDAAIYRICARFHVDNWRRMQQSHGAYQNPYENIDALASHSVVARNEMIAKTLLAELKHSKYPILFVGNGHIGPIGAQLAYSDEYWQSLRGALNADDLERLKKADRRGIADFLKDAGVGFYFLTGRGNPIGDLDIEKVQVKRYFKLFQSQLSGDIESYVREFPWQNGSVTVSPSPQAASQVLLAAKNAENGEGDKKDDKGKKNGKGKKGDGKDGNGKKGNGGDGKGGGENGDDGGKGSDWKGKLKALLDALGKALRGEVVVNSGSGQAADKGPPNSIYEQVGPDGKVVSRTYYDEHGNATVRQDFESGHGFGPHEHTRDFDANGQPKTREDVHSLPPGYGNERTPQ